LFTGRIGIGAGPKRSRARNIVLFFNSLVTDAGAALALLTRKNAERDKLLVEACEGSMRFLLVD